MTTVIPAFGVEERVAQVAHLALCAAPCTLCPADRVFGILRERNPELTGERRRTVLKPPQVTLIFLVSSTRGCALDYCVAEFAGPRGETYFSTSLEDVGCWLACAL